MSIQNTEYNNDLDLRFMKPSLEGFSTDQERDTNILQAADEELI